MTNVTELRVNRRDLTNTKIAEVELAPIEDGEALLEVTSFGITANNVTYGVVGEQIGYWQFFPTPEAPETGIIPVWGFGTVVSSKSDDLKVGEELYGYFPMATHMKMAPKRKGGAVFDTSAHRAQLPPAYNAYRPTADEPEFMQTRKDQRSVLFPLFATSYIIADWLQDNDFFGAEQVIITSASSKTSFGTGAALSKVAPGLKRIGLTSPGREEFVRSLNAYDEVISYDDISQIDTSKPTAFVDMAGNAEIITAVHNHLQDNVKTSAIVGATHWQAERQQAPLPGAKPTMFFAPAQIQKRDAELGAGVLMANALKVWMEISDGLGETLRFEHHAGGAAVDEVWKDTVRGTVSPDRGITASLLRR